MARIARVLETDNLCAAISWFTMRESRTSVDPYRVVFADTSQQDLMVRHEWAHINLGSHGFFVQDYNIWLVPDFRTAVLLSLRFD